MRSAKRDRQAEANRKIPTFTTAEKLHKRRDRRKNGPSALRRAERRERLQPKHRGEIPGDDRLD